MQQFPGALIDVAYCLPDHVLTNDYLSEKFPHWQVGQTAARTGVFERRIARPDQTAYDLALVAVKKLLNEHQQLADLVDGIIFCTQSPDYVMPSNAFLLQKDCGFKKAMIAFDYNLACSGYIYGLAMATSFIKTGLVKNMLVVTADTYSKYLAEDDRSTRMLFGDGASASWVGVSDAHDAPLIASFDDFLLSSDGSGWDKFIIRSGAGRQPCLSRDEASYNDRIHMDGLQVLNFVNDRVIKQMLELLRKNDLSAGQIDQFLLHQASGLALNCIRKRLKVGQEKVFSNLATVGNTVSSSIPILIKDYFSQKELEPGSRLLLCGFGVGYSWASLLASK